MRLTSLPVCVAPLGSLGPVTLDPVFRLCSRRYCAEDSPSFPRPSLLESHISLMHGIRNPDLSQTSKVRPSGGHSPQVSRGPLPLGVTCPVSASSWLQGPMCDSSHGACSSSFPPRGSFSSPVRDRTQVKDRDTDLGSAISLLHLWLSCPWWTLEWTHRCCVKLLPPL